MFGEVNEKQAEYLQDILSSGRHLLSLINDILDLSKVEAGRLELELGAVPSAHRPGQCPDPGSGASDPARDHADPDGGRAVGDIVADERKVKQILLNLLSNAVKFTPEGAGSASPPRRPMAPSPSRSATRGSGSRPRIRRPSSRSSARSGGTTPASRRARGSG